MVPVVKILLRPIEKPLIRFFGKGWVDGPRTETTITTLWEPIRMILPWLVLTFAGSWTEPVYVIIAALVHIVVNGAVFLWEHEISSPRQILILASLFFLPFFSLPWHWRHDYYVLKVSISKPQSVPRLKKFKIAARRAIKENPSTIKLILASIPREQSEQWVSLIKELNGEISADTVDQLLVATWGDLDSISKATLIKLFRKKVDTSERDSGQVNQERDYVDQELSMVQLVYLEEVDEDDPLAQAGFNEGYGKKVLGKITKARNDLEDAIPSGHQVKIRFANMLHHGIVDSKTIDGFEESHVITFELPTPAVDAFISGEETVVTENEFWNGLLQSANEIQHENLNVKMHGVDVSRVKSDMRRVTIEYLGTDLMGDKSIYRLVLDGKNIEPADLGLEDGEPEVPENEFLAHLSVDQKRELKRNRYLKIKKGDPHPINPKLPL